MYRFNLEKIKEFEDYMNQLNSRANELYHKGEKNSTTEETQELQMLHKQIDEISSFFDVFAALR